MASSSPERLSSGRDTMAPERLSPLAIGSSTMPSSSAAEDPSLPCLSDIPVLSYRGCQPPEILANRIVSTYPGYSLLSPSQKIRAQAALQAKMEIARKEWEADAGDPEIVASVTKQYTEYYTKVIRPAQLKNFSISDFPLRKPNHLKYSEDTYKRMLQFTCSMAFPSQSASDEQIAEAGYSSWREYVISAVLRHWHSRISRAAFRRRISFLPGCAPPFPSRPLPRRSRRLAPRSSTKRTWADSDSEDE